MVIRTPEQLLAKLEIQEENIGNYKTEVGASNDDVAEISRDKAILQFVVDRANVVEAGKKTTNAIKIHVFDGDENETVANYPVFPTAAPPEALVGGCLSRFKARNRRFKSAKGYTKEIGIALGIEETKENISPETVKPTLTASAAQTGYLAAVVVGNRGDSTMWKVFGRRLNSETREVLDSGTGKSADIIITPTTPGQPEKMQITVQLYRNNEPYGQLSDAVSVTFNP